MAPPGKKRVRTTLRLPRLSYLLPKVGFDYGDDDKEAFTMAQSAGYFVKTMMDAIGGNSAGKMTPEKADKLIAQIFDTATQYVHITESIRGFAHFWSVIMSHIDWIRAQALMTPTIIQELAWHVIAARLRRLVHGPYIRDEDLSHAALAVDKYRSRMAEMGFQAFIPILYDDDEDDDYYDEHGDDYDEYDEEIANLDAETLEQLGLYDHVYGHERRAGIDPDSPDNPIVLEDVEFYEDVDNGKRKAVDNIDKDSAMTGTDADDGQPGMKKQLTETGYNVSKRGNDGVKEHIHRSEPKMQEDLAALVSEMKAMGIFP